jgi:hypothetical protein
MTKTEPKADIAHALKTWPNRPNYAAAYIMMDLQWSLIQAGTQKGFYGALLLDHAKRHIGWDASIMGVLAVRFGWDEKPEAAHV